MIISHLLANLGTPSSAFEGRNLTQSWAFRMVAAAETLKHPADSRESVPASARRPL